MTRLDNSVIRTERGWAGHFCCADRCMFRRNTLLEYGKIRIVISTVGMMKCIKTFPDLYKFETIGYNRYYETMAFHAYRANNRYWDADVTREVRFNTPWGISKAGADDKANDMHEAVVTEITEGLKRGNKYEPTL